MAYFPTTADSRIAVGAAQVNVRGSKIFSIGGECDDRVIGGTTYTHYPRFSVVGDISVV